MDKRQRFTLLGIAAAIAVVAVAIALVAGGDDDEEPATTGTQATETRPQPDSETGAAAEPEPEPEPTEPEPAEIRFEGGEPVGGVEKISVAKGDRVTIVATGDAADELHLHGYDITRDVEPGKPARLRFKADIEGVFELELHSNGAQLAKVTVEP